MMQSSSFCQVGGSGNSSSTVNANTSTNNNHNHRPSEDLSTAVKLPPPPATLSTGYNSYVHTGTPYLAQSLVLSRLAAAPTLLPENLASLITAISLAARVSIRASALFIEAILESLRYSTVTGLGLTRRALISAVSSARALHYVNQKLDWSGKDEYGVRTNDAFLQVLDKYTNLGVYLIHHTFTLAELFAMSGFSLTLTTIQTGFLAAEESVRMFDGLLGSNETSRALASIITMCRKELTDDPRFSPAERGAIASLAALTKALTAFVCLQVVTHKRTLKELKLRVVYDCTIILEGRSETREYMVGSLAPLSDRDEDEEDEESPGGNLSPGHSPPTITRPLGHSRASSYSARTPGIPRTTSSDTFMTDLRAELDSVAGRTTRSRAASVHQEEVEIGAELKHLCGADSDGESGDGEDELPLEVRLALRDVQEGTTQGDGKRIVRGPGKLGGFDYEIEVERTTTRTTTVVRTFGTQSAPVDDLRPRTVVRKTQERPSMELGSDAEVDGHSMMEENVEEDEWVEVSTMYTSRDRSPMEDREEWLGEAEGVPMAMNGVRSLASLTRQDTIEHPKESKERLQVVLRKMTKTFTQKKRTIRRLETVRSRSSSPAPRSKSSDRHASKQRKADVRELEWPAPSGVSMPATTTASAIVTPSSAVLTELVDESDMMVDTDESMNGRSPPKAKINGANLFRAFSKAMGRTPSQDSLSRSPPSRSPPFSRTNSSTPSPEKQPPSTPIRAKLDRSLPSPIATATPPPIATTAPTPTVTPKAQHPPVSFPTSPTASSIPPPVVPSSAASYLSSPDRRRSSLALPLTMSPLSPKAGSKPLPATHGTSSSKTSVPPRIRRTASSSSMRSVVTTVTHASAKPQEEAEPKASNFPHDHLVENLRRFMRYSSAAYGQAFLRILGIGKHDFNFPHTQSHANDHAFAHHVGIKMDDILLSSYTDTGPTFSGSKISPIVNYVSVDHAVKAVVLSCRGSLGLSDLLVDLTCTYEPMRVEYGDPNASYYVHSGVYLSATTMQRGTVHDKVKEALLQHPTYGLVVCGHSLGGGVAALLSILWSVPTVAFEQMEAQFLKASGRTYSHPPLATTFVTSVSSGLPPGRAISCFAYGPPCVASPDLVRYCRGLVTSTIHNFDIVPTLSLGVLRDLKNTAMGLNSETGTAEEIVGRVIGLYQNRFMAGRGRKPAASAAEAPLADPSPAPVDPDTSASLTEVSDEAREVSLSSSEIVAGKGLNKALDPAYRDPSLLGPEVSEDAELNDWMWSLVKTMRAGHDNEKLYPPGTVYVMESWTVFVSDSSEPSTKASGKAKYSRREGRRVILRAVDNVETRFSEPVFGRTMMSDHSPSGYEEQLELLATAVIG